MWFLASGDIDAQVGRADREIRPRSLTACRMMGAKLRNWLRQRSIVDALVWRYGPAAMRVPWAIRRRAISQTQLRRLTEVRTWQFGAPEVVVPNPPDTANGTDGIPPLALRRKRLPSMFVAEVKDSTLVGVHAVPFTREGRMLLTGFLDSVSHIALEPHPELEAMASGEPLGQVSADLGDRLSAQPLCSLVGRFDSNYFHWLIKFCSQLEALRQYAEATSCEPAVLVRDSAPRFVPESLALLGIGSRDLIGWPLSWSPSHRPGPGDRLCAVVPNLVVPSWRGDRHVFSPRSLAWLRSTLMGAATQQPAVANSAITGTGALTRPIRLCIARRQGGWRSIINNEEVECFLGERDFMIMRPEDYTLSEQIRMVAAAEVIVGMHGAGLTNILFAPDAHLIELAGGYVTSAYFGICGALGNGFTRVPCTDSGDDVVVDTKSLGSALCRIGVKG